MIDRPDALLAALVAGLATGTGGLRSRRAFQELRRQGLVILLEGLLIPTIAGRRRHLANLRKEIQ